jgi:hypothetical protein
MNHRAKGNVLVASHCISNNQLFRLLTLAGLAPLVNHTSARATLVARVWPHS